MTGLFLLVVPEKISNQSFCQKHITIFPVSQLEPLFSRTLLDFFHGILDF